jgi:hypothetical protein
VGVVILQLWLSCGLEVALQQLCFGGGIVCWEHCSSGVVEVVLFGGSAVTAGHSCKKICFCSSFLIILKV